MCPKTGALMVFSVFVLRDYRLFSFKFFFPYISFSSAGKFNASKVGGEIEPKARKRLRGGPLVDYGSAEDSE